MSAWCGLGVGRVGVSAPSRQMHADNLRRCAPPNAIGILPLLASVVNTSARKQPPLADSGGSDRARNGQTFDNIWRCDRRKVVGAGSGTTFAAAHAPISYPPPWKAAIRSPLSNRGRSLAGTAARAERIAQAHSLGHPFRPCLVSKREAAANTRPSFHGPSLGWNRQPCQDDRGPRFRRSLFARCPLRRSPACGLVARSQNRPIVRPGGNRPIGFRASPFLSPFPRTGSIVRRKAPRYFFHRARMPSVSPNRGPFAAIS